MSKKEEKARIRAKLSEQDREYLDALKEVFPSARLKAIRFSDGETIGKFDGESQ